MGDVARAAPYRMFRRQPPYAVLHQRPGLSLPFTARTHQSTWGPTAHPGPTILILLKSAPVRRTSEEALHYGVTAAATGITEGAHESRPPRPPRLQGPAVTPAACTRCYIAQRRPARPSGRAPRQAAAHSPARTCPGSRYGGCSRPRCAGLRHGQRVGPDVSRCPTGGG